MKNKEPFFIRQHIKMSPKARPSNNPNKIRLTFLEPAYRLWKRSHHSTKSLVISLFFTALVPFVIYKTIMKLISREYKSRAQAVASDNFYEMQDILKYNKIGELSDLKNKQIDSYITNKKNLN